MKFKRKLIVLSAVLLAALAPSALLRPAPKAGAAYTPQGVVLNACDSAADFNDGENFFVSLDRDITQDGNGSVRVNSQLNNQIALETAGANYIDITGMRYLTFWLYTADEQTLNSTAKSYVRMGSSATDYYMWDLMNSVSFIKGWNFVALDLNQAYVMGAPDDTSVNTFVFYRSVPRTLTVWFDSIAVGPSAEAPSGSASGTVDLSGKYGGGYSETTPSDVKANNLALIITGSLAGALLIACAALVTVKFLKGRAGK